MENRWYSYLALACAIWFALTSWIWIYLLSLFFSYPVGVVALLLYYFERKRNPESKLNRWVLILLLTGWLSSILVGLLMK